jgi:proteasome lid subunit RPN8/RPN11
MVEAIDIIPARNILGSKHEFLMDPRDVIMAYNRARSAGLDLVGIYHTHIEHPSTPSQRDADGMRLWPIPWLIMSIPSREIRAWSLCGEHIENMELYIV